MAAFIKTVLIALVTIGIVLGLSHISSTMWGGKPETISPDRDLTILPGMTVGQFAERNELPKPVVKDALGLRQPSDLQKPLASLGFTESEISGRVNRALALAGEESTKNWLKIRVKFALWIVFLAGVFVLMRRAMITPRLRWMLYGVSVLVFGVVLGADPSPMGTVKDAVALYGANRVIFPPRMIALGIFLALVVVFNKSICAWGCQFGVMQDLLFRINRNRKDTKGVIPQVKLPFVLTNTVRILFFAVFTSVAVAWVTDIVDPIDPFKVYKPAMLSAAGWIFLAAVLVGSLFVYRPWCHLFCPFGLVGWLAEKISVFRIRVKRDTCISCNKCAESCPSDVMSAILHRDKMVIPDCFACGVCIDVCPTDSVVLGSRG